MYGLSRAMSRNSVAMQQFSLTPVSRPESRVAEQAPQMLRKFRKFCP
jgi:hypothetical protein